MYGALKAWLREKWWLGPAAPPRASMERAYDEVFSTLSGQAVLHDLIDKFYMVTLTVPNEPYAAMRHLGHCDVLHVIMENIDQVRNPQKYEVMKGQVMANARR